MKCSMQTVYTETMRFDYETFIAVDIRRYRVGSDQDVVMECHVCEDDINLVHTKEVVDSTASDANLQRKGIKAFDALKAEFGERFSTVKAAQIVPLEF